MLLTRQLLCLTLFVALVANAIAGDAGPLTKRPPRDSSGGIFFYAKGQPDYDPAFEEALAYGAKVLPR